MSADVNSQKIDEDLAALWAADHCPLIDGVIFGDGRVKHLNANWKKRENGRLGIVIEQGGWTTLNELRATAPMEATGVIHLCAAEDHARGLWIRGGEGGWGGDGFVAVLRMELGVIEWVAFFSMSNPFDVVRINGDIVLARNNLGIWWRFPLNAPEEVTVEQLTAS